MTKNAYRFNKISTLFFLLFVCCFLQLTAQQLPIKKSKTSTEVRMLWGKSKNKIVLVTFNNVSSLNKFTLEFAKEVKVLQTLKELHTVKLCLLNDDVLTRIVALGDVVYVDTPAAAATEIGVIGYNPSWQKINAIHHFYPFLRGNNIAVGVKERKVDDLDVDLLKRIIPSNIASTRLDQHANVIASIIAGGGNTNYDATGVAQSAKIFSSSFDNLFADAWSDLNPNNIFVQNHSYGTAIQSRYGVEAQSYDLQTWQQKQMLHVFSVGNSGQLKTVEGKYANIDGFANLTGNFKMAKNIITVGGIVGNGDLSPNSSKGPLYDGRIAPQLVALGPNGTSDAAAMVSGTLAVLQQIYKDSNANILPQAALLKAILYNTAIDFGRPGVDFESGYGMLNALGAAETLFKKQYRVGTVSNGQSQNFTLNIPSGIAKLKITMSYTDSVAALNNNKALINDLDISLTHQATGSVYKPQILSLFPQIDSLKKLSTTGIDSLNTSEQIVVDVPAAGNYTISVKGSRITSAPIDFAIAYKVDTLNKFRFTNPLLPEDVNPSEIQFVNVLWEAGIADTNQVGLLDVNINGLWNNLGQVKLYQSKYVWPVPTDMGPIYFRMQTSFGTYFSPTVMLHPQVRMKVDFNCSDSLRLSWQKHSSANQYELFGLVDSAYLKLLTTVSDTFIVLKKSLYPSLTFAVQPKLANGLKAIRSISLGIEQSATGCFYQSFYYDLLAGNEVKLLLELSTPAYLDSIYFETLDKNGNVLVRHPSQKVGNTSLFYSYNIKGLSAGLHYFRAVLKPKSGGLIYTESNSVLISGSAVVRFYPNPTRKGVLLKRVVLQGISPDKAIQFFTLNGLYIRGFNAIPDLLDTRLFPTGIVIYRVLDDSGKTLETGKILISE